MTLASVTKGIQPAPYRILVHGVDGVGKTTFAADAPKSILLGAEDGSGQLDVARFPTPRTFQDILDAIQTLILENHDYQSLGLDSLDWIEPLIWQQVCESDNVQHIEEYQGGYGKGYVASVDLFRQMIAALERLQAKKGMNVILIAHSLIKPFRNPEGDDFERWIIKLNEKAAGLCREWVKGVYFANYETFAVKDKAKRVRGVSTGARLLYTQRTAAYDAKDRYGLPASISLSWEEFDAAAKKASPADPKALAAEIERKAKELGGEIEKFALDALQKHGTNVAALAKLNDRLNAKLGDKAEQGEV